MYTWRSHQTLEADDAVVHLPTGFLCVVQSRVGYTVTIIHGTLGVVAVDLEDVIASDSSTRLQALRRYNTHGDHSTRTLYCADVPKPAEGRYDSLRARLVAWADKEWPGCFGWPWPLTSPGIKFSVNGLPIFEKDLQAAEINGTWRIEPLEEALRQRKRETEAYQLGKTIGAKDFAANPEANCGAWFKWLVEQLNEQIEKHPRLLGTLLGYREATTMDEIHSAYKRPDYWVPIDSGPPGSCKKMIGWQQEGNGWVTVGLAEVLSVLLPGQSHIVMRYEKGLPQFQFKG